MNRFLRSALFPVVVITLIVWLGTQTLMNNHSKSKRETLSSLYATPIEVLRASDGRIVVVGQPEEEVSYHAHRPR